MIFVVKNAVPYASGHQGSHFFTDKSIRFLFQSLCFRDVNDVAQFFLTDTCVVVQFGLVTDCVHSVHMKVQVEVTGDN